MTEVAKGWAVRQGGKINVKTVHDDKRGALVNYLVAEAGVNIIWAKGG